MKVDAFGAELGSIEEAPLFVSRTRLGEDCVWSLDEIKRGKAKPLRYFPDHVDAKSILRAPDGSYWVAADKYFAFYPRRELQTWTPYDMGDSPSSVGVTADGIVFAIESHHSDPKGIGGFYLVDLTLTKIFKYYSGEPSALVRGYDGHLYFVDDHSWSEHDNRKCTIYEIGGVYRVTPRWSSCVTEFGVDADGTIWATSGLGVERIDKNGAAKYIGPIEPMPCSISNTAALMTRALALTPAGVWFIYHDWLWRIDRKGNLSKIRRPEPEDTWPKMVGTADGSLWVPAAYGIYQFVPADPHLRN